MLDYIFVACNPKYGCITLSDNNNKWVVSPSGTWIPDVFDRDERYLDMEVERWCFRTRKFILTKPIYLIEPDAKQLALKPGGN